MTTRDVDEFSRKIALDKGNDDFTVSHARLVQIENGESTPSVYKLYSLSVIYGCRVTDLLALYVDLADTMRQHLSLDHAATHLIDSGADAVERRITFPVRFDPGFNLQKSSLLSRMVEVWGEVPVGLLQHIDIRRGRWGLIGLNDYTMYPLLRPGSLVQIDDRQRPVVSSVHRSEHDRPIYFIEVRDGYLCSWCEFRKGSVIIIPHPLSGVNTREFAMPAEAEIVGRVTAVAARLVPLPPAEKPANPPHPPGPKLPPSAIGDVPNA